MKRILMVVLAGISLLACKRNQDPKPEEGYTPGTPPGTVRQWILQSDTTPLVVPPDFVGMHLHRWPNIAAWELDYGGKISPKPPFPYGARRLWDYAEATAWTSVDIGYRSTDSTEVRNWELLDEVMDVEATANRKIMITINGTPTALSSNPTAPGKFPAWKGHQYAPKDAAAYAKLQKYVADLVGRYGSKLSYIDTNNEPDPENPIPEEDNFWVGTKQEHAQWHRMQRLAVPRGPNAPLLVGPSIVVWDWEQDKSHAYTLSVITAADFEGTKLIDHLDAFSFHYYARPTTDPFHYWQAITAVKATLAAAGKPGFPIYDTEHGSVDGTNWNNESRQQQATQLLRHAVIAAASGIKMVAWYSGDGNNLGQPSDGGPVSDALTTVYNDLTDLEVHEAAILEDGRCWIRGIKNEQVEEFIY